jgi:hypothetical protein
MQKVKKVVLRAEVQVAAVLRRTLRGGWFFMAATMQFVMSGAKVIYSSISIYYANFTKHTLSPILRSSFVVFLAITFGIS